MKKSNQSKRGGRREGSGRPRLSEGEDSVLFSGKVPESLAARVDELRGDTTRSALLRKLLEKWVRKKK